MKSASAYFNAMRLRVRDYRASKGLTQLDLAAAAGVRPATISKAENEPETMELRTLMQIARGLGVELVDLFDTNPGDRSIRDMVRVFVSLPREDRIALTRQAEALASASRNGPPQD